MLTTRLSDPVFVAGRAIIGLGLASFLMTSLIVVQEITHPRSREAIAASWVRINALNIFLFYTHVRFRILTGFWVVLLPPGSILVV